jgi:hypothetical protein
MAEYYAASSLHEGQHACNWSTCACAWAEARDTSPFVKIAAGQAALRYAPAHSACFRWFFEERGHPVATLPPAQN